MKLTSHSKGQNIIPKCDAFLENSKIKDLTPRTPTKSGYLVIAGIKDSRVREDGDVA
jgi:hypothetical protein